MKVVQKAVPCLLSPGDTHVLCFVHPSAGMQIPKGTVRDGEGIAFAAVRELREETGIEVDVNRMHIIGRFARLMRSAEHGIEHHTWWICLARHQGDPAARWLHPVSSDGEDDGMIFQCYWHRLGGETSGFHRLFIRAMDILIRHLEIHRRGLSVAV